MINEIAIKQSFQKIKKDVETLAEQNKFLYNQLNQLRLELAKRSDFEKQIQDILKELSDKIDNLKNNTIKTNEVEYTSINNVSNSSRAAQLFESKINTINSNNSFENKQSNVDFDILPRSIESPLYIKEKIKTQILEICKVKRYPGDVKRAIVDVAKLCSKATFYRYLSELKKSSKLQSIDINNEVFLISSKYLYA